LYNAVFVTGILKYGSIWGLENDKIVSLICH